MIAAKFLSRIVRSTTGAIALRDPARSAPRRRSDLNRAPLPALAYLTPWLSVVLASLMPGWPFITLVPLMPPLGFLTLLAWRQLHPGVLPVWAGLPLGLIDDLVSGQPLGSGVLLWSAAMLGLEAIELRWPWRNFWVEWAVAAAMIAAYLVFAGEIANFGRRPNWLLADWLLAIPLQMLLSMLIYPTVARFVAWLDRLRLTRFRVLRYRGDRAGIPR